MKIEKRNTRLSLSYSLVIGAVTLGGAGCGGPVDGGEAGSDPTVGGTRTDPTVAGLRPKPTAAGSWNESTSPRSRAESNLAPSDVEGGPFFMGQWWDDSGLVHVAAWSSDWVNGYDNTAECAVPYGWLLVGGGAEIYTDNTYAPEAYLTASYPDGVNQKWIAKSTDHAWNSQFHALSAYCIGLQLSGLSFDLLRSQTHYVSATSSTGEHPSATVHLTDSFPNDVLVGGGAKMNYPGAGILLTETYGNSEGKWWTASGKDHGWADYGTATAYAIGIAACPTGWGGNCIASHQVEYVGSPDGHDAQSLYSSETPPWAMTTVGGKAVYQGSGRALRTIIPGTGSQSKGADYVVTCDPLWYDLGHANVDFIGIVSGF